MNKTSSAIVRTLLLGTTCLSVFGLSLGGVRADPTGGTVVTGSATIANHGANNTVINQTTNKALINWQSFSIAAGDTVRFNQPGSGSITLNRVIGSEASSIYGSLLANGQVWLINGNGILFGGGSRINVGGLIATTSDIANDAFANGNYSFTGGTGAAIVNQGTIRTRNGGFVVLSGASVSNQGLVAADTGTIVLGGASAFTVDFTGDNLLRYAITAPPAKADNGQTGVANSGTISAAGGRVIMTARAAANVADAVVNNTGIISATSAKLQNGEVVLDAGDGDVTVAGSIDASGTGSSQTGGSVTVTGRSVTIADNTQINVSGDSGGGRIRIGGDLHGAGSLQNADNAHVGSATIDADAIRRGNGGTLVVWSNGLTDFSGIFSAKGGATGGDGGFIETSGGTLRVAPTAQVDTRAAKGSTGTWLLDPDSIAIANDGTTSLNNGQLNAGDDPGSQDRIAPSTIVAALTTTNVALQAVHDIGVFDPLNYNSAHSLSLLAGGNINIESSTQNAGAGAITLVAGWNGVSDPAHLFDAGNYGLNGGSITIGDANARGDSSVGSAQGALNIYGANLTLSAVNGYAQVGYHGAGGGDINVKVMQNINGFGNGQNPFALQLGNGTLTNDVVGNVTGNINLDAGGQTVFFSQVGRGWLGNSASAGFTASGNITSISVSGSYSADYMQADLGTSPNTGGNLFIGFRDNATAVGFRIGGIEYNSPHALVFATGSSIDVIGRVINDGTGDVTLVAGWDGHTVGTGAQIRAAGAYGLSGTVMNVGGNHHYSIGDFSFNNNQFENVSVGSAGGLTSILTGSLTIAPASTYYAQLGYHGPAGGNIAVVTRGDLTMTAGSAAHDYAMIGNGSLNGDVRANIIGNIEVRVGGTTRLVGTPAGGASWIGNFAGTGFSEVGNLLLVTFDLHGADELGANIFSDLAGGDVTIGVTNAGANNSIDGNHIYNSAHTLNLLSAASLTFNGSLQNNGSGAINIVAGWDGVTLDPAHLADAGVFGNNNGSVTIGGTGATASVAVGSKTGTTSLYASNVSVIGTNGFAQLGYHGTGGGAIKVVTLHDMTLVGAGFSAMVGNGSLTSDVTGDETGTIDVRLGGNAIFNGGGANAPTWFGNVAHSGNETGNVLLVMADETGTQNSALGSFIAADLVGGDFTIGFTGPGDQGPNAGISYNSSHTLSALTVANFVIAGSVQNAGTGAINLVAGWDGHTVDLASLGNAGVAGNNGKGVTIGGTQASGNVAVGSAGGTTSVYGASLALTATNGYAQLGFNGHGTGALVVDVTGGVAVTGGSAAGWFAQIGNGGLRTSGNNGGNILITAGGDLVLTGGAGAEAYAQVGHGGAESNTGAAGYSNVSALAVTATNVILSAGAGAAAYTQIGNGGYESGLDLVGGTATNGGNITITVAHAVSLLGNGADSYSQIGNGGSKSNLNAAAAAGGTDSGDIIVHAPNGAAGSVTLASGSGANSYTQIGNGGYAVNAGATTTTANWTVTGNVSVTDLSLTGGNSGGNAYSQIGNGDASRNSAANVIGNIFIDANGQISYTNGTAPHSPATIGNFTGQGTSSGTLSGAQPPSELTSDPVVIGNVAANTANNGSNTNTTTTIATIVITSTEETDGGATGGVGSLDTVTPGPLASLDANGGDSSSPNSSDGATVVIADSLDGSKKPHGSQTILAGILKQNPFGNGSNTVHGVPPADQDFSSWGNEALWQ